jgi:hypothetical protein
MPKAILELPKMPESCRKCKLSKWETWRAWEYDIDTWTNVLVCTALGEECSDEGRRTDCPLKPVEDKEVE